MTRFPSFYAGHGDGIWGNHEHQCNNCDKMVNGETLDDKGYCPECHEYFEQMKPTNQTED